MPKLLFAIPSQLAIFSKDTGQLSILNTFAQVTIDLSKHPKVALTDFATPYQWYFCTGWIREDDDGVDSDFEQKFWIIFPDGTTVPQAETIDVDFSKKVANIMMASALMPVHGQGTYQLAVAVRDKKSDEGWKNEFRYPIDVVFKTE